jgi:Phage integrase family
VDIYKRKGSKFWLADFTVSGQRFRKSTGVTTKVKAMEVAAELLREAQAGVKPARKGPMPVLSSFIKERFLPYIQASQLDSDTKRYYETGWRLLAPTRIADWRLDRITTTEVELLQFSGTGSTANCALRTLRRILSLAREWDVLQTAPRIKLRKEKERTAIFTAEREKAFLDAAPQPLRDVFLIVQDSGMRPDEVIRMRWENVLWHKNLIFVPEGKTDKAKRHVPLSDRVRSLLRVRAQGASVRSSCGLCYIGIRLRPLSCNLLVEAEIGCCRTGNHSRTTAESEVLECPLSKHQHPALKLDDVHQVNERPNEPRRQPGELESKCIRNRSGASNHGKVSLVEVFEGWQLLSRFDSFYDGLRRVDASRHRDLGKTGQLFSRAIEGQREIPNHEYVSEARQSQAGFDLDPAALVRLRPRALGERPSKGRSGDASGPDYRSGIQA